MHILTYSEPSTALKTIVHRGCRRLYFREELLQWASQYALILSSYKEAQLTAIFVCRNIYVCTHTSLPYLMKNNTLSIFFSLSKTNIQGKTVLSVAEG